MRFAYLSLFAITAICLRRADQLRLFGIATTLGASVVAAYACIQWLSLDPLAWPTATGRFTAFSTAGARAFLGGYLAVTLPLTIAAAIQCGPSTRKGVFPWSLATGVQTLILIVNAAAWTWTRTPLPRVRRVLAAGALVTLVGPAVLFIRATGLAPQLAERTIELTQPQQLRSSIAGLPSA